MKIRTGDIFEISDNEQVIVIKPRWKMKTGYYVVVAAVEKEKTEHPCQVFVNEDVGYFSLIKLSLLYENALGTYSTHVDHIQSKIKKRMAILLGDGESVQYLCEYHMKKLMGNKNLSIKRTDPFSNKKCKCSKCEKTGYKYAITCKN